MTKRIPIMMYNRKVGTATVTSDGQVDVHVERLGPSNAVELYRAIAAGIVNTLSIRVDISPRESDVGQWKASASQ
jgi:hypothetical protein